MIPILTDSAICMCPHGGQLKFIVTHMKADGMDGQVLTLMEYSNAMIVGCANPPISGGPCLKVAMAQDPIGRVMKVNGNTVVTPMVISITNLGLPIIVVSPGNTAISIKPDPSFFPPKKLSFLQRSAETMGVSTDTGSGSGSRSIRPFKDVVAAFWGSEVARREQTVILQGTTVGFGDGTPATLLVYRYDLEEDHTFVERLSGSVADNGVRVEWPYDYQDDVDALANRFEGDDYYAPPEYFFELKVGGKSARSGLLPFVDSIEIELVEEGSERPVPRVDYVAHLADGRTRLGSLDDAGRAQLVDVPPGRVHWEFRPQPRRVVSAAWGTERAKRDEVVALTGETSGFADGTPATLQIVLLGPDDGELAVAELESSVEADRVEAEWTVAPPDVPGRQAEAMDEDPFASHRFVIELTVEGRSRRSAPLEVLDAIVLVRLEGMFFDTNRNFLLPTAMNGIRRLVEVYDDYPESEVLIVGHTDATGTPGYNDPLSLERAEAVGAFLRDDVEAWLARYDDGVAAAKRWGAAEDQNMIRALPGAPPGASDRQAILWFQERYKDSHDLGRKPVDGIMGPKSRRAAIGEYMALDGTTLPEGASLTLHGCGENFPRDDVPGNDDRNRRVELFLFTDGIDPPPPGSNSGPGAAEYPIWLERTRRRIDISADAERFEVYLLDGHGDPIPGAKWQARPAGAAGPIVSGTADDDGLATILGAVVAGWVTLAWTPPYLDDYHYHQDFDTGFARRESPDEARLRNLGYGGELADAVRDYQYDHFMAQTGVLADIAASLRDWHDGGDKPPAPNPDEVSDHDLERDAAFVAAHVDTPPYLDDVGNVEGPDFDEEADDEGGTEEP